MNSPEDAPATHATTPPDQHLADSEAWLADVRRSLYGPLDPEERRRSRRRDNLRLAAKGVAVGLAITAVLAFIVWGIAYLVHEGNGAAWTCTVHQAWNGQGWDITDSCKWVYP